MQINFTFILLLFTCLLIGGCKKDKTFQVRIKGNVRNNCSGKGFENIQVRFFSAQDPVTVVSDANGDFDFGMVRITAPENQKYSLSIADVSNNDYEIYGISVSLSGKELYDFHQFGISASFKTLHLVFPDDYAGQPGDSIDLSFHQKTLKMYEPGRIVDFSFKSQADTLVVPGFNRYYSNITGYPMGWWQIHLKKRKNGVVSSVSDSVFLDLGAVKTYTIPW